MFERLKGIVPSAETAGNGRHCLCPDLKSAMILLQLTPSHGEHTLQNVLPNEWFCQK